MDQSLISEADYKNVWDWLYAQLRFIPSTRSIDWPSIRTDKRYLKFKIDFLWGTGYSPLIHSNFVQKAIEAFIDITIPGEEIYALDWRHECYYYDPRKLSVHGMLDDGSSIPKISFIPDGDYYIFVTKDFENIWFGHPWEKTITVLGDKLIAALNQKKLFAS
jgi:hypothetical protein